MFRLAELTHSIIAHMTSSGFVFVTLGSVLAMLCHHPVYAFHESNVLYAREFYRTFYPDDEAANSMKLLDVGGTLAYETNTKHGIRGLQELAPKQFEVTTVNMIDEHGVDLVLTNAHEYPFSDDTFDLVTSSNVLEHDEWPWDSLLEQCRVAKSGGFLFHMSPNNGPYHAWPADRWRYFPDAAYGLASWARKRGCELYVIQTFIGDASKGRSWHDHVMVFRKGSEPLKGLPKKLMDPKIPGGTSPALCNPCARKGVLCFAKKHIFGSRTKDRNCEGITEFDLKTVLDKTTNDLPVQGIGQYRNFAGTDFDDLNALSFRFIFCAIVGFVWLLARSIRSRSLKRSGSAGGPVYRP